ncbi:2489_t:CDS:1 [Acaulospora colombiana]|uniref:2489_t:CDS:1 n=1 Tax=Acaulospora colombiana TaxID=27376 RepID=A0ACA9K9M9_9GLOM|nr:2489_t:CDS:1 [Acaulospora colombiana]
MRKGEKALVDRLTQDIQGIEGRVCCGGKMSVPKDYLRLFFENKNSNKVSAIQLPANDNEIKALFDACVPATFGRGNEDVFDVEYRNAVCLDLRNFAIQFHPSATDLLNEISKWMVSNHHSLRAESYRLNIYAPGGHFKKHVDTPRGNDMVGSLVVCFPSEFEGGQLNVRHKEKNWEFNWETASNQSEQVQWAAFYSDCEHEILPVTKGYRVTLTYNLYSEKTKAVGNVSVDLKALPFYHSLKLALQSSNFLSGGGILGFCLQHAYPLTKGEFRDTFGSSLKGSDILLYEVARGLGLNVEIKAVYEVDFEPVEDDSDDCEEEFPKRRHKTSRDYGLSYQDHKVLMVGDEFVGGGNDYEDERSEYQIIKQDCDARIRREVVWCNRPTEWNEASTYIAYGNEATSASIYVAGAFLVNIPPWDVRRKNDRL